LSEWSSLMTDEMKGSSASEVSAAEPRNIGHINWAYRLPCCNTLLARHIGRVTGDVVIVTPHKAGLFRRGCVHNGGRKIYKSIFHATIIQNVYMLNSRMQVPLHARKPHYVWLAPCICTRAVKVSNRSALVNLLFVWI
jgi:hypothetical protein